MALHVEPDRCKNGAMSTKPIRSEADYDKALRRVELLWGSTSGTPEGDELDIMVDLVEAYERRYYPIDLPTPVEAIKFRPEQQGKDYLSSDCR